MRRPRALAAASFVGAALMSVRAQAAPQECFAAADEAQTLRDEGHYTAARERLAVCSGAACPAVVQRDCSQWMEQLVAMWPTIVVRARDLQGRDLVEVKVSVDGKALTDRLDGTPLQVDPGEHHLSCETEGAPAVEQTIVVRAAEKNRIVDVPFATGSPAVAVPAVAVPIEPGVGSSGRVIAAPEPAPSQATARTLRWVFGGTAVAAFGTAMVFGFTGLSRYDAMKSTCAPKGTCNPSDVSFTNTHFAVSDVSVGLGLASAAAAAYFFYTTMARPTAAPPARAAGIVPQISVGSGGASLGAGGVF